MSVAEAIDTFKKSKIGKDRKVIAYWERNDSYILQTEFDGFYSSNFFMVDGDKIRGVTPIQMKLRVEDRKVV